MSNYAHLTDGEKAHVDEYVGECTIMDWPGYDGDQTARRKAAWHWLDDRKGELWHDLYGEDHASDAENKAQHRQARYQFLDDVLDGRDRTVRHPGPDYPKGGCTDWEKVYIAEREKYVAFGSTTDDQKARKTDNLDGLVGRRKEVWHLMQDDPAGNESANREQRYNNLCIATHHGTPWEEWQADQAQPAKSSRQVALDHMEKRVGYTEQPDGSNTDTRDYGIRTAQVHCAGGGDYLIGTPWCGEWCYYALEAASVQGIDSHLASVAQIEDYARSKAKCYRGWTTDRSSVERGDLVVIGGYGVHVEMVRGFDGSNTLTYGGNTSPGTSGSQSNGGGAYERSRSPGEVRGYACVDYPG
jgi:hypothetical protein